MSAKLEKDTAKFIASLEGAAPLYTLTPEQAREVLEKVQSTHIKKPEVHIEDFTIPAGISLRIVRLLHAKETLPVIMYFHGAGWVMGSAHTHDYLIRQLAVQTNAAVVFLNYPRSPEVHYPVAVEQAYAATHYIAFHGHEHKLDAARLVVSGDSVGGNMTIAVTMLAKERKGPKIRAQALFYPVTDAGMDTPSYEEFAQGPWLTKAAMTWFWDAYEPNVAERKNPLLSPLQASYDAVQGLPKALIITAENDVLRDEGEAYAHKLMHVGVPVTALRMLGTIHDFAMLHALAHTPAAKSALTIASEFLKEELHP
jgi:acetyl esterase